MATEEQFQKYGQLVLATSPNFFNITRAIRVDAGADGRVKVNPSSKSDTASPVAQRPGGGAQTHRIGTESMLCRGKSD